MAKVALLLVDIQNDYFPSYEKAKFPLDGIEEAAANVSKLMKKFRDNNLDIIHVRQESPEEAPFFKKGSDGAKIHESVKPIGNEYVITKNYPNSFKNTNLKEILEQLKIESLIIVGAMSHMCIDATVRAASDYEYDCTVVSDACATRSLEFQGIKIPSEHVHASYMAALEFAYAKVKTSENIIKGL